MTALLIVAGCTADKPQPPTPPSRVLQSVAVQMTPDGTMTAINGTAVSVRDNAADATTENTTYSPRQVADDLPVRVTTSYRTDKRAGTNLADLNGYSGRVEIDLSVQNLTVKPQNLTYDVAGSSRTQPAMVGSPLTVVASTSLPDIKPTDVVTATAPGETAATNGVLSQSESGGSVIQWAALLAAPQTGTSATLRLVSDVKDFKVPTIDMSVEPGLVTDPSVGGVIDSAFNSDPTSQLALEQRTIKVITDVNQVLTRASDNISDVRRNLDSTSQTLGTRTTEELKTSTQGVSTSMKGLDQELKSLNSDISSTLGDTESSVLEELSQTVGTMDQMLGDTSAPPPTPVIDGNGCKTVVQDPKNAGTVYGNLMQVTAQLDGYATATGRCKTEAQQVLLRSVGPAKPSDKLCEKNPSTTCSLYYTEQKFGLIMEDLVAKGNDLVDSLQPEFISDAQEKFAAMSGDIDQLDQALTDLDNLDAYANIDDQLTSVETALDDVDTAYNELSGRIDDIHHDAETAITKINSRETPDSGPADLQHQIEAMQGQTKDLARQVCQLWRPGVLGKTQEAQLRRLRLGLVNRKCAWDQDDDNPDDNSLYTQLGDHSDDQAAAWQAEAASWDDELAAWKSIAGLTDTDSARSGVAEAAKTLNAKIHQTRTQIELIKDEQDKDQANLDKQTQVLRNDVESLKDDRKQLGQKLDDLKSQQDSLGPKITTAFNNAATTANDQVAGAIDPQIRKVTTQAQVDSEAVGDMFDQSAAGLSSASDKISRNGTKTIKAQRQQLQDEEKHANSAAAKQVDQALTQMAKGVSASTRDMNGASAQLTNSLNKVLLDLGTRKVNGSGLLGSMTTSAAKVGSADYQLALASTTTTSYAGVRGEDVNGILLRQAQLSAALQAGADLPAFHLTVPSGAQSQTVYTFQIKEKQ